MAIQVYKTNTSTSLILRNFIILCTALISSSNKLPVVDAQLVFDIFVKKANLPSIPSNFFGSQFIAILSSCYGGKVFETQMIARTTYLPGLCFHPSSLDKLAKHLYLNRNFDQSESIAKETNYLYFIAVRDLVREITEINPDPRKVELLKKLFNNETIPDPKSIKDILDAYRANVNFNKIEQLLPAPLVTEPVKLTLVNASVTVDEEDQTLVEGELQIKKNQLKIKNSVLFKDPNVSEVVKRLVEQKQTKYRDSVLSKQEDPNSVISELIATEAVLANFNVFTKAAFEEIENNSLRAQELSRMLKKEKRIEQQEEKGFQQKQAQIQSQTPFTAENLSDPDYQAKLRESKNTLNFLLNERARLKPNDITAFVTNCREANRVSTNVSYIEALNALLKSTITRYKNADSKTSS